MAAPRPLCTRLQLDSVNLAPAPVAAVVAVAVAAAAAAATAVLLSPVGRGRLLAVAAPRRRPHPTAGRRGLRAFIGARGERDVVRHERCEPRLGARQLETTQGLYASLEQLPGEERGGRHAQLDQFWPIAPLHAHMEKGRTVLVPGELAPLRDGELCAHSLHRLHGQPQQRLQHHVVSEAHQPRRRCHVCCGDGSRSILEAHTPVWLGPALELLELGASQRSRPRQLRHAHTPARALDGFERRCAVEVAVGDGAVVLAAILLKEEAARLHRRWRGCDERLQRARLERLLQRLEGSEQHVAHLVELQLHLLGEMRAVSWPHLHGTLLAPPQLLRQHRLHPCPPRRLPHRLQSGAESTRRDCWRTSPLQLLLRLSEGPQQRLRIARVARAPHCRPPADEEAASIAAVERRRRSDAREAAEVPAPVVQWHHLACGAIEPERHRLG
eukprot:scaffold125265_cov69-Phaeocystis_antarctica.AAC.1